MTAQGWEDGEERAAETGVIKVRCDADGNPIRRTLADLIPAQREVDSDA